MGQDAKKSVNNPGRKSWFWPLNRSSRHSFASSPSPPLPPPTTPATTSATIQPQATTDSRPVRQHRPQFSDPVITVSSLIATPMFGPYTPKNPKNTKNTKNTIEPATEPEQPRRYLFTRPSKTKPAGTENQKLASTSTGPFFPPLKSEYELYMKNPARNSRDTTRTNSLFSRVRKPGDAQSARAVRRSAEVMRYYLENDRMVTGTTSDETPIKPLGGLENTTEITPLATTQATQIDQGSRQKHKTPVQKLDDMAHSLKHKQASLHSLLENTQEEKLRDQKEAQKHQIRITKAAEERARRVELFGDFLGADDKHGDSWLKSDLEERQLREPEPHSQNKGGFYSENKVANQEKTDNKNSAFKLDSSSDEENDKTQEVIVIDSSDEESLEAESLDGTLGDAYDGDSSDLDDESEDGSEDDCEDNPEGGNELQQGLCSGITKIDSSDDDNDDGDDDGEDGEEEEEDEENEPTHAVLTEEALHYLSTDDSQGSSNNGTLKAGASYNDAINLDSDDDSDEELSDAKDSVIEKTGELTVPTEYPDSEVVCTIDEVSDSDHTEVDPEDKRNYITEVGDADEDIIASPHQGFRGPEIIDISSSSSSESVYSEAFDDDVHFLTQAAGANVETSVDNKNREDESDDKLPDYEELGDDGDGGGDGDDGDVFEDAEEHSSRSYNGDQSAEIIEIEEMVEETVVEEAEAEDIAIEETVVEEQPNEVNKAEEIVIEEIAIAENHGTEIEAGEEPAEIIEFEEAVIQGTLEEETAVEDIEVEVEETIAEETVVEKAVEIPAEEIDPEEDIEVEVEETIAEETVVEKAVETPAEEIDPEEDAVAENNSKETEVIDDESKAPVTIESDEDGLNDPAEVTEVEEAIARGSVIEETVIEGTLAEEISPEEYAVEEANSKGAKVVGDESKAPVTIEPNEDDLNDPAEAIEIEKNGEEAAYVIEASQEEAGNDEAWDTERDSTPVPQAVSITITEPTPAAKVIEVEAKPGRSLRSRSVTPVENVTSQIGRSLRPRVASPAPAPAPARPSRKREAEAETEATPAGDDSVVVAIDKAKRSRNRKEASPSGNNDHSVTEDQSTSIAAPRHGRVRGRRAGVALAPAPPASPSPSRKRKETSTSEEDNAAESDTHEVRPTKKSKTDDSISVAAPKHGRGRGRRVGAALAPAPPASPSPSRKRKEAPTSEEDNAAESDTHDAHPAKKSKTDDSITVAAPPRGTGRTRGPGTGARRGRGHGGPSSSHTEEARADSPPRSTDQRSTRSVSSEPTRRSQRVANLKNSK